MTPPAEHPDKLLWYVNGRLEASEREAIRAHLQGCGECEREAKRLESLRVSMRLGRKETAGQSLHPTVEDLVALESQAAGLGGPAREHIERHLEGCPDCREDLDALTAASRAMAPRPFVPLQRTRLMALAAALLVAIVGFAWAMTFRQTPAEKTLLLPGLRSAEQAAALSGSGPWPATVVLPFDAPDGVYWLALAGPDGSAAAARLPHSGQARQGRFDTVIPPLAVPGVYTLTVKPEIDAAGSGWNYLLRVGPGSEAATSP